MECSSTLASRLHRYFAREGTLATREVAMQIASQHISPVTRQPWGGDAIENLDGIEPRSTISTRRVRVREGRKRAIPLRQGDTNHYE